MTAVINTDGEGPLCAYCVGALCYEAASIEPAPDPRPQSGVPLITAVMEAADMRPATGVTINGRSRCGVRAITAYKGTYVCATHVWEATSGQPAM